LFICFSRLANNRFAVMTDYIFENDQAPIMYVLDLRKPSEFTSGNFKIGENLTNFSNFEILNISPAKVGVLWLL